MKKAELSRWPRFFPHEENETMQPLGVQISIAVTGYPRPNSHVECTVVQPCTIRVYGSRGREVALGPSCTDRSINESVLEEHL